jgi:carboxyl-terminal processing protease
MKRWGSSRPLLWVLTFSAFCTPVSTDFSNVGLLPPWTSQKDFSTGSAVVPMEEVFAGLAADSDAEVVRHALRIVEQHYVQREKLDVVRLLSGGLRALNREYGSGGVELGFLRPPSGEVLQLSSKRTVRLCPSRVYRGPEICADVGLKDADSVGSEGPEPHAVIRIGLRVFGLPISAEPGLKSLDLVGRFIVPEFARLKRVPVAQAVHTYLNGLCDELDPHSAYMTQEEYRELRSGTRGQFGGVGLVIDESQELPVIREVVPNSPAHMSGVRPGDVLLRVGNSLSSFQPLDSVLKDIRDLSVEAATPVWFFRPSSRRVYRSFLAREEIPTRSVELRTVMGRPDVLFVRVTGFSNHTAEDVYAIYEHSQLAARGKLKLFVLDLRGNPGGLLDQAIQVSDLFLRQGQIVSTRSRFEEQVEHATRGTKIDLPLVVLVNSSSASASEIVAGALKDQGRALVVGERTFGKGSVQSLFELATGTALKLTVAHYFTPRGRSLQGVGVEPHVNIKLVQPREGYLWMSGSSELDREEHLVSHLQNPGVDGAYGLGDTFKAPAATIWAYFKPEENVIDALRPLHFSYPLGDNTQTIVRLEDDPVARVGVGMGSLLFSGRASASPLVERQFRDALRKVSLEESVQLRSAIDKMDFPEFSKSFSKSFFDGGSEDKLLSGQFRQKPKVSVSVPELPLSGEKQVFGNGLRDLFKFFDVFGRPVESGGVQSGAQVSLAARSMETWQSDLRLLMSLSVGESSKSALRSVPLTGLVGLRLDDLHDGPTAWMPAQFVRSNDRIWVSSIALPKAIRTYLSSTNVGGRRPTVVGHVKWRLADEGLNLGSFQLPPLLRREGRLEGQLLTRGGQNFLQIHFLRPSESEAVDVALQPSSQMQTGVEVLLAPLTDTRLKINTEVVPLQKLSSSEYFGEAELKLNVVTERGLGFSGLIGGVTRSSAGDILASAPLLWVGDEGVYPIHLESDGRISPEGQWSAP